MHICVLITLCFGEGTAIPPASQLGRFRLGEEGDEALAGGCGVPHLLTSSCAAELTAKTEQQEDTCGHHLHVWPKNVYK